MKCSPWYLYVVKCSDSTLYTGVTTDLSRRLIEHNTSPKGAKYTKRRRPVVLVYAKHYADRSQAQKAEYQFKSLTRKEKIKVISEDRVQEQSENKKRIDSFVTKSLKIPNPFLYLRCNKE